MTDAVILLDWHRTLSHSLFWEHWTMSGDGATRAAAARLASAVFAMRDDELAGRWMRGEVAAEDVMALAAPVAGIDPGMALDGLMESCERMALASPEILPRVRQLRASGVRVGIATDNMDTFQRWTVPALGLDRRFDPILSSADLGALKADPLDGERRSAFFGPLLAGLDAGTNVFLVDDSSDTAPVAEALGMTFCQVTPERDVVWWLDAFCDSLLPARESRCL